MQVAFPQVTAPHQRNWLCFVYNQLVHAEIIRRSRNRPQSKHKMIRSIARIRAEFDELAHIVNCNYFGEDEQTDGT